jgi:two-component system NtrC family sensor kinase
MMDGPIDIREIEPVRDDEAGTLNVGDPALLVDIFNTVPGRAVFLDTNFRYRLVNREFLDFVGKVAEQVIGLTVADVLGEAVFASYALVVDRVLGGEAIRWEGWADYPGFGRRYIQEAITPYRHNGDGPVLGVMAIARDLTDLKQRELDLAEQLRLRNEGDALHKAVVSTALDCIIIVDADGRVVDFNPAAERLFGYTAEQAMGREISQLIIPEKYRKAHLDGMARYMVSGVPSAIGKRLELEALTAQGKLIPVEIALADVSINEMRYFTAHIRDLSQQKQAAAEISRQRDAIYQKEKLAALGSLLSGVAHELNNPLSIVIGQAMMLREKVSGAVNGEFPAEDIANRAMKIETAANRCARIVKTFLAMARQRKAERTEVSIAEVITDATELLAYGLKSSGVALVFDIAKNIPGTSADADLLHQVIVNLIVNARQALEEMSQQDRSIVISAHWIAGDDTIEIRVRDNGPGIKPSIRGRIFDPFFTTKTQDHGTGIGLAVSRGLIEAHGGTLTLADDQPERGAEFLIRLPVQPIGETDSGLVKAVSSRGSETETHGTILIVDDEPELGALIADMVGDLGYQAEVVLSGNAASQFLKEATSPVDAILCDIRMPDGDGPSLYEWLSANRPELVSRIGFVTGDTLGPSAGRFLARTGCPVIEKPFTPDDINTVIESLTAPHESALK